MPTISMLSPFEPILSELSLPVIFQEQFLLSADAPYILVFEGAMDEVWHRPRWLWPFFWALAWFDMLFPETGRNVPASMQIIGGRDKNNLPLHHWHRTFAFPTARRHFNATMSYDPKLQAVTERMGPGSLIHMVWHISFSPPTQIEISSAACYLSVNAIKFQLHKFLYPFVSVMETGITRDIIHVNLKVSHPLLGAVFGYAGNFHVQRVSR